METGSSNSESNKSAENAADDEDLSNDPLAYTKRDDLFTSEKFKIEIKNLPKHYGFAQLRKRIINQGVTPVKVKAINRANFCFATFRSEEERDLAVEKLNKHLWKGHVLTAKKAVAKQDPLTIKRMQEDEEDAKVKKLKTDDGANESDLEETDDSLPLAEQVCNRVTPYKNLPYDEQLKKKQVDIQSELKSLSQNMENVFGSSKEGLYWLNLQRKKYKGLPCELLPIVPHPDPPGFRNKFNFTIGYLPKTKDKSIGYRIGRYQAGSVGVYPPFEVDIVPKKVKDLLTVLTEYIKESPHDCFDTQLYTGYWESVLVRTSEQGELLVGISLREQQLTEEEKEREQSLLKEFFTEKGGASVGVTSLHVAFTSRKQSDQLLSGFPWKHIHGQMSITETLLGLKFQISPNSFFQVSTPGAETIYTLVADWCNLSPETVVLDICCGTGTIGQTLAKRAVKVYGFEIVPEAAEDARHNANFINGITNVEYICGDAAVEVPRIVNTLNASEHPNIVAILDPPRAGCSPKVIQAIRRCSAVRRLVYVACNVKLAKTNLLDLSRPSSKKFKGEPFRPVKAVPVDMFPQTSHQELVMLWEKL